MQILKIKYIYVYQIYLSIKLSIRTFTKILTKGSSTSNCLYTHYFMSFFIVDVFVDNCGES